MKNVLLISCGVLSLGLSSCSTPSADTSETAPVGPPVLPPAVQEAALGGTVDFRTQIAPILAMHCLPCHDGKFMIGHYNLTDRRTAFQPGASGSRIVPGYPDKSPLFLNPESTHKSVISMPPVGNRLTNPELAILRRWIVQGAAWPEGQTGVLSRNGD